MSGGLYYSKYGMTKKKSSVDKLKKQIKNNENKMKIEEIIARQETNNQMDFPSLHINNKNRITKKWK